MRLPWQQRRGAEMQARTHPIVARWTLAAAAFALAAIAVSPVARAAPLAASQAGLAVYLDAGVQAQPVASRRHVYANRYHARPPRYSHHHQRRIGTRVFTKKRFRRPATRAFGHRGFKHHRFDHRGVKIQRFDHRGFRHRGISRHGFKHRGFGGRGFKHHGFTQHGFKHHGFSRHGFKHRGRSQHGVTIFRGRGVSKHR